MTGRAGFRVPWLRLIACVGLGFATTVGVAWWCAIRSRDGTKTRWVWDDPDAQRLWTLTEIRSSRSSIRHWTAYDLTTSDESDLAWLRDGVQADESFIERTIPGMEEWRYARSERPRFLRHAGKPRSGVHEVGIEFEFGWPLTALWYARELQDLFNPAWPSQARYLHRWRPSWFASRIANPAFGLPLAPVWLGLISNTIIYGSGWLALVAVPLGMRRWRRRRRGCCAGCGYDLAGGHGGGCPECGLGVAMASGAAAR